MDGRPACQVRNPFRQTLPSHQSGNEPTVGHQVRCSMKRCSADDAGDQGGALGNLTSSNTAIRARGMGAPDQKLPASPENQVDDVLQRDVVVMRAMVTAPADMQADLLPRDAPQRMIEGFNPHLGIFAVFRQGDVG